MENQHRLITGYRELTTEEIAIMNEIKAEGDHLMVIIARLRSTGDTDNRWIAIGETHLQQGLMALARAVAKPTSF